jgi:hypothetical protein
VIALVLLSILWWAGLRSGAVEGLRLLANALLPDHVFWSLREIAASADGGWVLKTWLQVVGSSGEQRALLVIGPELLAYVMRGLPMTLALVLATAGWRPKRWLAALAAYALVALLACAGMVAAQFAVMLNHETNLIDGSMLPPPYRVNAAPVSSTAFFLACYADYIGRLIAPVVGALMIWVALCQRELLWLRRTARRRHRSRAA